MNIIQSQADDFISEHLDSDLTGFGEYKEFIANVRNELYQYHKDSHKIDFLQRLIVRIKTGSDEHAAICPNQQQGKYCHKQHFYENSLFFLQNELDKINEDLSPIEFTSTEKSNLNDVLQQIQLNLKDIRLSSEFSYDDIMKELQELRELYFLNKKNWMQLFIGKLTEMIAGGILSETVSKDVVEFIRSKYPELIK